VTGADLAAVIGGVLLLLGAGFTVLATIGVLRFPDLLTRLHAASKAGAVGGGLILLAVGIVSLDAAVLLRAIVGIAFLMLTTPVAAHLLARANLLATGREADKLLTKQHKSISDDGSQV
jgi:multicomponent Na+:H+ antiporter subunit G